MASGKVAISGFLVSSNAYTNANLAAFSALASGGVATFSLSVPNDPALSGASLSVQATAATALNSLTIATSNGLLGTFGL